MSLEQLPLIMLRALILTVMIECIAAWMLGVKNRRGQTAVMLVNVMTNPLVVSAGAAVRLLAGYGALLPATLVMEIIVVIAEGLIYSKRLDILAETNKLRCGPFILALACNAASYITGEILNRWVF